MLQFLVQVCLRGMVDGLFNAMLDYTGSTLIILSVISLGVGIVYLIMAEREK